MYQPTSNDFALLDSVPEKTASGEKVNPMLVFEMGEEVDVKGVRMRIVWITDKRISLEPMGLKKP